MPKHKPCLPQHSFLGTCSELEFEAAIQKEDTDLIFKCNCIACMGQAPLLHKACKLMPQAHILFLLDQSMSEVKAFSIHCCR